MSLKASGREELRQYIRSIKGGGHGCIMYEDEDQMWDLQAEYLKLGIEQGYLSSVSILKEDLKKTREALIRRGIDVDRFVKEGSLEISYSEPDELYTFAKNPDLPAWLKDVKSFIDNTAKSGKKGVYIATTNTTTSYVGDS